MPVVSNNSFKGNKIQVCHEAHTQEGGWNKTCICGYESEPSKLCLKVKGYDN